MSSSGIARRRLLLSKARKLLGKKLLKDVSMNDVAEAAKIPKGSAYFFYDSIDSLWAALVEQMYEELGAVLLHPLPADLGTWAEVFKALLDEALTFIDSDPALSQLLVGPYIPPALKMSERSGDVGMGRIVDQQLSSRFVLPEMPDRPKLFFLALEIVDVLCTVSMIEHGRLTQEYKAECVRASVAYLRTYLPDELPRVNSTLAPRK
jgi:AcrR family transcriptional regulator